MFLLDRLLLGAPIAGFRFVLKQLANIADRELIDDEEKIMLDIRALHERRETGEITERTFRSRERVLMERWRTVKRARLGLE